MSHILVTSTAEANQDGAGVYSPVGEAGKVRQRVRRFQCGNNALGPRKEMKGLQCLVIFYRNVVGSTRVTQMRVFGPNPGIIQPGGNRMGRCDLPIPIL